MTRPDPAQYDGDQGVRIGLSAVVIALHQREAAVLTASSRSGQPDQLDLGAGEIGLPFGPFDPARDRTFELALRAFVTAQTGFDLGFVEQLYTFGDAGRASPKAAPGALRQREVSVGYLALTGKAAGAAQVGADWSPLFSFFPWEDHRGGRPAILATIIETLCDWAANDPRRLARIHTLFAAAPDRRWNEERVLERYELLYEASLVLEAARDRGEPPSACAAATGRMMTSDHRRILATGLGRLRSKLKYRPVLFDLTPETFTLFELQAAAEAVAGLSLHKQNFRRGVERTGLVEATGRLSPNTGGRPAELFRYIGADPQGGPAPGLPLPALR